jgi:helicase
MLLREVPVEEKFLKLFSEAGIEKLFPPQEAAVRAGLLEKKNLILATQTASGKTLTAELAAARALAEGGKVVYIVPLRALAFEKFEEFQKYEKLGYTVRIEVGDLDSSKYAHKPRYDILIATAEKCDSILRSRPEWFDGVGLLVLDEIHLIASDRGPVYEILAAKLRKLRPAMQVLGLSATIGNADELAGWLSAELVESSWRPVKLSEEVAVGGEYEGLLGNVKENLSDGGQVMVFVNTRKSAESAAERIGEDLKLGGKKELAEISEEILSALSSPTSQCRRLSECMRDGVAFHHAGLVNQQRKAVEDAFKEGLIKVIVATPTLAAGVNLPSRTVILRDVKRYGLSGLDYIPVFEYKQMTGRAGRPKYDKSGRAVTLAKNESECEYITEKYVNGESEPIYSQLGIEPVLRFHVLSAVASNFTRTPESLLEFFAGTFYGFQYGVADSFRATVEKITGQLIEWGFLIKDGRFLVPTPLGARVSELYLDPQTARNIVDLLSKAEAERKWPTVGLLEVLCDSSEMASISVKPTEESALWSQAYSMEGDFYRDIGGFDLDWDFLPRFKTALLFDGWVNEKTEEELMEDYDVTPGQLYQRLSILEWLAYAGTELSRLTGLKKTMVEIKNLEERIKHGVREELVPLVSIKYVGRARARRLYAAGLKKPDNVRQASLEKLSQILGKKTAEKIMAELT